MLNNYLSGQGLFRVGVAGHGLEQGSLNQFTPTGFCSYRLITAFTWGGYLVGKKTCWIAALIETKVKTLRQSVYQIESGIERPENRVMFWSLLSI